MYGGAAMTNFNNPITAAAVSAATAFDEVYVLSLPAFTWFKADYPAVLSRYAHSCTLVDGQMISVGGSDPSDATGRQNKDPFVYGIGVFDLSSMEWSSFYNPAAANYKTPSMVASYYYSK
jgi:hypothetical protein